jgi:hypothetical protein
VALVACRAPTIVRSSAPAAATEPHGRGPRVRVPNNGRCRRRYTEDQDNPHLRTDFEPVNDIGARSANNHQGHAVATDREHTAGQMTTTTKCRNVEKIHGGGVIHRCTGVGSAISCFSLHFDCSGYAGCCSDLQRPGELHWIHLAADEVALPGMVGGRGGSSALTTLVATQGVRR